ncbi:putative L-PSP endoribonuclease family protein [Neohortaea acidophila]|uniref:Putative L-PSP endoribonuclease family protein n=1 Tax=Neohortaea acidophila TaxID=245834 RepID=A0A6A6PMM0_9PEZI|nr:putative L-PSP endoribonuclease family protein [Neohortaea acidophila]KAF2481358.1 putative L-PSP endoribonuclease family protein [Neohortaea acidophila]
MGLKQIVKTDKAPAGLKGIFNQAIIANGMVYCSGSVAMDPETGKIVDGDVKVHTHRVLKNLSAVLEAAGTSMDNVVKVNVFLADMGDFAAMNEVYTQYFGEVKPCRTCVAVKTLPLNTDVEIEVSSDDIV